MKVLKIRNQESGKISDEMIIQRILQGEKSMFEILMRRYNQTLYRVIRSYLKDENGVEDVMQDAYLKAYEKLSQFQGGAAFSTWLIRIGINEALLRLRKSRKKRSLFTHEDDLQSEKIIQLPDHTQMNPEKRIIHQETSQLLEKAIDKLPEKYSLVYILKEVEGMEHHEIATCLGLSESNVKVRLHRAKTLLKEALYKLSSNAEIFEFGNSRCDRVVDFVMNKI